MEYKNNISSLSFGLSWWTEFLKRHSLIIGLVLMFLYTWTIDLSNAGGTG